MSRKKRGHDPGITASARVAPHDACIGCYRGDTTTVVPVSGEAEWIITAISKLMGIPTGDAEKAFTVMTGCDPGKVPAGTLQVLVHLCQECARKAKVNPAALIPMSSINDGEAVLAYVQPMQPPETIDES